MLGLRWRDVDWTAARVRVRQNYVLGEFGTPKSKRSTRSVPMADDVAAEHERLYRATEARIGREPREDELVFVDPLTGEPLNKKMVLLRYRRALRAARLDETHRFHDLRHTFGTQMAAAGVAIRTLQEWMGHRDIQTTMRYAEHTRGRADRGRVRSDCCRAAWWRDGRHRWSADVKLARVCWDIPTAYSCRDIQPLLQCRIMPTDRDKAGSRGPFRIYTPASLGDAIRHYRTEAGLTQAQLAAMTGLGRSYLSELETGKETEQLKRILRVLRQLGVRMTLDEADW